MKARLIFLALLVPLWLGAIFMAPVAKETEAIQDFDYSNPENTEINLNHVFNYEVNGNELIITVEDERGGLYDYVITKGE